jgi:GTPase SAR1 family protein
MLAVRKAVRKIKSYVTVTQDLVILGDSGVGKTSIVHRASVSSPVQAETAILIFHLVYQ